MFKDILLPVDLDETSSSQKALSTAVGLCRTSGGTLHVMVVVPGFGMSIISQYFPKDFEEKTLSETAKALGDYVAGNVPSEVSTQTIVANGTVYEEILRVAEEIDCDLIVMAAHRPALQDYLLGPNAARVVRHANCSVLVVRE